MVLYDTVISWTYQLFESKLDFYVMTSGAKSVVEPQGALALVKI